MLSEFCASFPLAEIESGAGMVGPHNTYEAGPIAPNSGTNILTTTQMCCAKKRKKLVDHRKSQPQQIDCEFLNRKSHVPSRC